MCETSSSHPTRRLGRPTSILREGYSIQAELRAFKSANPLPDYGWYPYDSLSALPVVADLVGTAYGELGPLIQNEPVADVGCGDGDWALLFSRLGSKVVDAVDHRETNFNQMRGVDMLRQTFGSIQTWDIDLDTAFKLPRQSYGFTLFLGTLYHLKNPFQVLEQLAIQSDWCLMSTRIAQMTPVSRSRIEAEPVAYLLGSREANNDPTNFWIFSQAGLSRILERAGWMITSEWRTGCLVDSDPASPEADERIYVLLKSRIRHPELYARPLEGWHEVEQDKWRWTAKRFSIEVTLPSTERPAEFALRLRVPEMILADQNHVSVSCRIDRSVVGTMQCDRADVVEFRGRFPESAAPGSIVRLDFSVESSYQSTAGDTRDLGIAIPLLDPTHTHTQRLPFRAS
jgi:hypothetical protein